MSQEKYIDGLLAQIEQLKQERHEAQAEFAGIKARASWAHTCIHHTDEQRKQHGHTCPVCQGAELARVKADLAEETRLLRAVEGQRIEAQNELAALRRDTERLVAMVRELLASPNSIIGGTLYGRADELLAAMAKEAGARGANSVQEAASQRDVEAGRTAPGID